MVPGEDRRLYDPSVFLPSLDLFSPAQHRADKAVYKQPPLDLVGWFSISSPSGPAPFHIPLHTHISEIYVESPILFLFHPSQVYTDATAAGKLPITLYESVFEVGNNRDDKAMDIDGAAQAKTLKFRELTYSIETGEAEMISVDFVARGGGNASAVEGPTSSSQQPGFSQETQKSEPETPKSKKGKGKAKEKQAAKTEEPVAEANYLTPEDEELLSSLTAKSNAIKMLSRRIDLLRAYLSSLPPSYLTDPGLEVTPDVDAGHQLPLDHTILRSINALLARLPILVPSETEQFILESQQEASDVQLIALLSSIQNSIATVKEAGRKHQIVELARAQGKKGPMGLGSVIHGFESATPTTTSFFDNGFPLDGKALRERALNSGAGGGWGPSEYLG